MIQMPNSQIETLPPMPGPIHFIGVGGIGMSGLARILFAWGYRVTGSDAVASEQTEALQAEGIQVGIGHNQRADAANAALVVVTAAVRGDNPELAAALEAGVPAVKRAQLLGLLANAKQCVAVAGSHGKSTTSGMIASALLELGAEPSYAIGAVLAATGTNAAPGRGDVMVVEADEYDYSFLWLKPDIAVVTNIEYDHPDLFRDQLDYDRAFRDFYSNIRPNGSLIASADDPGAQRNLAGVSAQTKVITFGESAQADWRLASAASGWRMIDPVGKFYELSLKVPGRHNALNALAAAAALDALSYGSSEAIAALASYEGVGRRFETKGDVGGVTVIDDYAHHPSEVRVTLQAARERFRERRLWAIFQPHTFSRTKALLGDFAGSFGDADKIVILDIYPSRETDNLGVSSTDLIRLLPNGALAGGTPSDAVDLLSDRVRSGDVVLTLGAGDVTSVGPRLLNRLQAKAAHA
ncbi:MAG: UDP-N-acetylmuramate--L-alanine ligase [Thermomicrobiales bacterium]